MACGKSQSRSTVLFRCAPEDLEAGIEVPEFTLLYRGRLPASTRTKPRVQEKHEIRKQIHRQLKTLWKVQTPFREISQSPNLQLPKPILEVIADNFSRCGFRFIPVVSERMTLTASLDILLLRRDDPGSLIKQGGDIDNRLKTLFDSLRMPSNCSELGSAVPGPDENPFYVLLEDDTLITEVKITTKRLLMPICGDDDHEHNVQLVIGVRVETIGIGEAKLLF